MNVREHIDRVISEDGAAHLTLIDPDEQSPKTAGEMASSAAVAGTDGIMIGGSTSAEGELLDKTVAQIKERVDLPTILFPASQSSISRRADAIFFMSLLNSENPFYITGAQKRGAPFVKKFDLEPISLAYIIIKPGGAVGRVGEADLIEREDTKSAVGYSLASQYFGMESVYLEAGSGADEPVPVEMVEAVRKSVDSLLIVGGGIRNSELAAERMSAGADVIVTGTIVEEADDEAEKIEALVEAIKE